MKLHKWRYFEICIEICAYVSGSKLIFLQKMARLQYEGHWLYNFSTWFSTILKYMILLSETFVKQMQEL